MKQTILSIIMLFSNLLLFAQSFVNVKQDSIPVLSSKYMNVWDRSKTQGQLKVQTKLTESDTIYTLCFVLKDTRGLKYMSQGEPMLVHFTDGRELTLHCNKDCAVNRGGQSMFLYGGLLSCFSHISFDVVEPEYDIKKEHLLSIVEGDVSALTFTMDGDQYYVPVRSNRFAKVTGEDCASLKYIDKKHGTKLTSKDVFGNTRLRYVTLRWNNRVSYSIGYDHLFGVFNKSDLRLNAPRNLFSMDMLLAGFYCGVALSGSEGNHYDYTTAVCKYGAAFKIGNMKYGLVITPYLGFAYAESKAGSSMIEEESRFLAGMRLAYDIKHFQLIGNLSSAECGFSVGYAF